MWNPKCRKRVTVSSDRCKAAAVSLFWWQFPSRRRVSG